MDTRFESHTVIMTRHPLAQALSVAKLGWLPTGKGLLRNAAYVEHWLERRQRSLLLGHLSCRQ